jgi:hypothetical protein
VGVSASTAASIAATILSCRRGAARTVGPLRPRPRVAGSATAPPPVAARAATSAAPLPLGWASAGSTGSARRSMATRSGRAGRTAPSPLPSGRRTGCRNPRRRPLPCPRASRCSRHRPGHRSAGSGSRWTPRPADDQGGQVAGFVSWVVIVIEVPGGCFEPAAGDWALTNQASLSWGRTGPTLNPSATIWVLASPTVEQT